MNSCMYIVPDAGIDNVLSWFDLTSQQLQIQDCMVALINSPSYTVKQV